MSKRTRWIAALLVAAGLAAILLLRVIGFHALVRKLNSNAGAANVVLTGALVIGTTWYAWLTRKLVRTSQTDLATLRASLEETREANAIAREGLEHEQRRAEQDRAHADSVLREATYSRLDALMPVVVVKFTAARLLALPSFKYIKEDEILDNADVWRFIVDFKIFNTGTVPVAILPRLPTLGEWGSLNANHSSLGDPAILFPRSDADISWYSDMTPQALAESFLGRDMPRLEVDAQSLAADVMDRFGWVGRFTGLIVEPGAIYKSRHPIALGPAAAAAQRRYTGQTA